VARRRSIFNDDALNSRNPFAPDRPPHQSRQYGANFGGPISKRKASFFVDFEKRDVDDEACDRRLRCSIPATTL
jgi:hypothetical protein